MGHISQIHEFLEFLACVLIDFFQDVYTEYFSEAISKHKKWSNSASFTCISEGWVLKREAKNICINLVHALVANQTFDTIFTSFCSALMSESVYYVHWIFIFLRSRFHSAWVKFHPLFHTSAQSGKSAAIIVSKSGTWTYTVIS